MDISKDRKHLSLRIDTTLLEKLRQVYNYEGRIACGQLLVYIRTVVKEFEKENGFIKPAHQ